MADSTGQGVRSEGVSELAARLRSDVERGLSAEEARERLARHGQNEIEREKAHPLVKLLAHFWGPIPWMLEIALVLSGVARRWEEFSVILVMLLINGGVSFWHESKADSAIAALKARLAPQARVIRDGEPRTIAAAELVPGDLVELRIGDVIPADVRLLSDQHLDIDESALTGESLPVDKEVGARVYSGTTVKRGEARALVAATGADTAFGRTVELVGAAEEASHFRRAVLRIGYFLISASFALVVIILAVGFWRGDPWIELVMFALVLTIAGIPQALPAVMTVAMTVGARRLARMQAIVSRLPAMEEIAGVQTLCVDKTGTLTRNRLQLQSPELVEAGDADELMLAAALTARPGEQEDPIDRAVLDGLERPDRLKAWRVEDFRPFDPSSKRAEATAVRDHDRVTVTKGAPQVILDLVGSDADQARRITARVDDLAARGYRTLGVARRDADGDWRYLGLLPFLDPPRAGVARVVGSAQRHGIDVRMITGDNAAIARQVARQVGLGTNILEAGQLFSAADTAKGAQVLQETAGRVLNADGFAEVTPEHKFALVTHFQAGDRIVGMTGDGVNDAPALKQADIGIAVAGATDAARAASDLVLTGQGLDVITQAVDEARRIFERMISYATFRITESMRVLLFIAISILAFDFYPVTAIMIILLAILNDIPIMMIAWDNAPTPSRPVRWDMRRVLAVAGLLAVVGVAASFLLFWFVRGPMDLPAAQVQTIMFLKLLVAGHMTIFLTRNADWMWRWPRPSWLLAVPLEATQIVGTLFAIFGILVAAIPWPYALGVWGFAIVEMLVLDVLKVWLYRAIGQPRARPVAGKPEAARA
jgi:H+-transporting ATPase